MTAIVAIRGDLSGRETVTRTIRLPAMRAAPHSNPTRVTGPLNLHDKPGVREVASVRIRVGRGRAHRCIKAGLGTQELARISFPSAAYPLSGSAIRSGILFPATVFAGSLLPFWRGSRHFRSVGRILRAVRTRLSLRVNSVQEPTRGLPKSFQVLPSLLRHDRNHDGRNVGNVRKSVGEIRNVER